ncbi:hypothetical protein [Methanosarcina siciliae]|uniref:hypothetical protein n=1 Tax=Methanosarcina siciliae TaxID=38027 RepID=UPI000A4749D6|nr:hypothetical protein [Methanosarcina siciliae]
MYSRLTRISPAVGPTLLGLSQDHDPEIKTLPLVFNGNDARTKTLPAGSRDLDLEESLNQVVGILVRTRFWVPPGSPSTWELQQSSGKISAGQDQDFPGP